MPPPSVWGPFLWNVLHGIGARCGKGIPALRRDEEREAMWILIHIEYCIPCKECIDHIFQFKKKVPIPKSADSIQEWICALHNSVNEKLGKPIVEFSSDQEPETSDSQSQEEGQDILTAWNTYLATIHDAIVLGQVSGPHLREFKRHMFLWMQCV